VMHSLQSGSMTVIGDTVLSGRLDVGEGLLVGQAGLVSQGSIYVAGAESSYFLGDISIGTTSASSELTVDGVIQATNLISGGTTNLMADAQGNIILEASDERLKENVVTLTGSLDRILELRGVSYAWKDTERFGDQQEIGFLAQEVDEVVPEVVRKGGSYWSLNTKNLLAVVVEAMKEMWTVVSGNQNRIEALETRVRELEATDTQPSAAAEEPEQTEISTTQEAPPQPESGSGDETDTDTDQDESEVPGAATTDPEADPEVDPAATDDGETELPQATEEAGSDIPTDTDPAAAVELDSEPAVAQEPVEPPAEAEAPAQEVVDQTDSVADTEPAATQTADLAE